MSRVGVWKRRVPGRGRERILLLGFCLLSGGLFAQVPEVSSLPDPSKILLKLNRNSQRIRFVRIPAGSFAMGSASKELDERPVHQVRMAQSFFMAATETTQAQYQEVLGKNPSQFSGPNLPVERVTWDEAVAFASRLDSLWREEGRVPEGFEVRLPSEAEWEYAARAGTTEDRVEDLKAVAWFEENASERTHPVGSKEPNAWGLLDMLGNVCEWCLDSPRASYQGAPEDGRAFPGGDPTRRVLRGGSHLDVREFVRVSYRDHDLRTRRQSYDGFRLVVAPRAP